jgi:predicted MFS family arabinose efflux permease
VVRRLAGLFSLDAFAGGFIVATFIVFWFGRQFGANAGMMSLVFFAVGLLQAGSSIAAGWLAPRLGFLNTMVFTHLPSNVLLALVPLAPSLGWAIALLLGRSALSQMDVPARQAYVAELVDPSERTAAASYTNAARYVVRPAGPVLASWSMGVASGLPFLIAGGLKAVYDLLLYFGFRRVRLGVDSE